MSSYSVQEVSMKWSQVALRWKTMHLGLSNLKHITTSVFLPPQCTKKWKPALCAMFPNPKIPLRLKVFPVEDSLCEATHLSSKGGYVTQTWVVPVHSYQIYTWKKEKCMLNLEQRVDKSKIKNGSHSKILLIVGARGVGVKILMDYGGEKWERSTETTERRS